ncbi:hypothetical protein M2347_001068 [Chryseobacterium sp. H1D6B]|uniref:hypothetical protein n=1 Tax=Chryseobacterium sp. H1D6B TaxID=2940588 RepID=UPI0015C8A4B3|nr:hypothetical protein [Chryseobacterium sp. H1D6B]MDH6251341.1 hypothetical protein [Chryseobacterium sp. H1D6B]
MVNWSLMSSRAVRKNIVIYLTKYYPCTVIDSIEKTQNTYKINLLNGLKLVFGADGSFMKNGFKS